MDAAGQDGGHHLQGGEHLLQGGAAQQDVGGLGDVSCVQVVVVGNILNNIIFVNINISWTTLLCRQVQNIFEHVFFKAKFRIKYLPSKLNLFLKESCNIRSDLTIL